MLSKEDKAYLKSLEQPKVEVDPILSDEQVEFVEKNKELTEKFGNSETRTFVESALSSASFGLTDQAYAALGADFKEALRERRRRNKTSAVLGEITGVIAPLLLSGGSSLLAKGAQVAGKGVATAGKVGLATEKLTAKALTGLIKETGKRKFAREVLKKSVAKGAGSAVEGTFYGVGKLVEENALGNADFNAENLIAYGGKSALFGGFVGAGLGGLGKSVSIVIPKFKGNKLVGAGVKKIDNFSQNMTNPTYNSMKLAGFADNEIEKILLQQPKMAKNIPEVLGKVMRSEGVGKSLISNKGLLDNSKKYLNKVGEDIGKVLKRIDDEVFDKSFYPQINDIAEKQIDELVLLKKRFQRPDGASLNKEAAGYINRIDDEIEGIWKKDLLNTKNYTAQQLQELKTQYHSMSKFHKTGELTIKDEINRVMGRSVRDELVAFANKVDSPLGKELQTSLTDYNSLATFVDKFNKKIGGQTNFDRLRDVFFGLGAYTLGMSPTSPGGILAMTYAFSKSDLKNKMMVLANIERGNTKVTGNIFKSVDKFFKKVGKFDPKIPALSAKLLTDNPLAKKTKGELILGKPKDEREAIVNMADNMDKIKQNPYFASKVLLDANLQAGAPETYQQVRQVAGRAMVFLDSKLPRKTENINPFIKKSYPSSDQEIYKFKKYVQAVQDPMSVLKDLNNGNLSREGIEAVRYVYPIIYQEMQSSVYEALEKAGGETSYKQRLQLGILMDMPTDLALEPQAIQGLQALYKEAQVSQAGGTITAAAAKQLDLSESQATELEKVSNRKDLNRS